MQEQSKCEAEKERKFEMKTAKRKEKHKAIDIKQGCRLDNLHPCF